jgi:putative chitinase
MNEYHLVAVYASRMEAERVQDQLAQVGLPSTVDDFRLNSIDTEGGVVDSLDARGQSQQPHESLWKRLFGEGPAEDRRTERDTNWRKGTATLSVIAHDEVERERVADLLKESNPVFIDQGPGLGTSESTVGTTAPVDLGGTQADQAQEGEQVIPMKLGADILRQVAPRVVGPQAERQGAITDALGGVLVSTLAKFAINNPLRVAHFLAQTCYESDGFCTTVEYASGQAYEGRADLGNVRFGDGTRYKGRGLIQLTGRANYQRYGELLELDLSNDPELAADPANSLLIACQFWKDKGLNAYADRDDIETITRLINGGLNGLSIRRTYLAQAKAVITGQGGAAMVGDTVDFHSSRAG